MDGLLIIVLRNPFATRPMRKALRIMALSTAGIAVVAAFSAFALEKFLPYRIGPANYARYLWAGRFYVAALVFPLLAIGLGIASRRWLSILLGVFTMVASLLFLPSRVHSGASPEVWCYFSLRRIYAAKEELAHQKGLTNGTAITVEELSPFIEGGFESLQCYEHVVYSIGSVGTEPRCSVHGSVTEAGGIPVRK